MALNPDLLQKLVELPNGAKRARCPACAEQGLDRKGEHLMIHPDGRFGCCVHPGPGPHRKRIFALAGERGHNEIRVRPPMNTPAVTVQRGILGRLAQVFRDQANPSRDTTETPAIRANPQEQRQPMQPVGTTRTGCSNSPPHSAPGSGAAGTPGTPFLNSRGEINKVRQRSIDFENPVRSVPAAYSGTDQEDREKSPHMAMAQAIEGHDIIRQAASIFAARSIGVIVPGALVPPGFKETLLTWPAALPVVASATKLEHSSPKGPGVSRRSSAFPPDSGLSRKHPRNASAALNQGQLAL